MSMFVKILTLTLLFVILCACKENVVQEWQIGGKLSKHKVIVDLVEPKNIKVCSDKYKNIGFPVNVNVDYDDQTYFRFLEGLCITVKAKKVKIRFVTPSSGKMARGTFEILDS